MRAFRATFLCAIDEMDAVYNDQRDMDEPVSLEEVKQYLRDAMILSFNDEEHGNPVGLQSMEVHIEELTELSEEETNKLYQKKP